MHRKSDREYQGGERMETLTKIKEFLAVSSGYGSGYGTGDGSGYGDGSGDGYGSGSGYGDGDGYGDGSGYGDGYGSGSGSGSGYGDGDGSGSGSGDGYGTGDGSGYGDGYGDGSGYGDGYGSGSGSGSGIKNFCGDTVYFVDGVQTMIDHIRGNVAHCRILHDDLTTEKCYVSKQGAYFAHGKTLHDAMEALRDKLFEDMPEEARIAEFMKEHELEKEYPVSDLYDWHHRLTGSCEMGRNEFAKSHDIDVKNDRMTVSRFIELTENAYGGDVIRHLEKAYENKT